LERDVSLRAAGLAALALLCFGAVQLVLAYGMASPLAEERFPVTLPVPPGASARSIAKALEQEGLVSSARAFLIFLRLRGATVNLQAGLYRFETPMTFEELLRKLRSGTPDFIEVTVPEGLTLRETAALIAANGLADRAALEAIFSSPALLRPFGAEGQNLEGYLFPDTYRFSPSDSAETIARLMVAEFSKRFLPLWGSRPASHELTLHETVTLASLVEKETGFADEKPRVAGVYANRLRRGMLLQCDPTVIYAMKLRGLYDGRLLRKDLQEVDSPYNTYLYPGLPPGPIAGSGADSLLAALAPEPTPYLFFVARSDGRHQFSVTLEEHNRAVWLHRSGRRAQEGGRS
jgi:UPF0755 protein